MTKLFIGLAIMMASTSILHSGAVIVPDVPSSIRHALLEAHPFATHSLYRFSTDDAGPFFQVEFEEAGLRQWAEYRYTDQNWLIDEGEWVAKEALEDTFEEKEQARIALDSGAHKR